MSGGHLPLGSAVATHAGCHADFPAGFQDDSDGGRKDADAPCTADSSSAEETVADCSACEGTLAAGGNLSESFPQAADDCTG